MFFNTPEQLTALLRVALQTAFKNQDVTIVVHLHNQDITLTLVVNKSPISQYKGEHTIYGKALRLLNFLINEYSLLVTLKLYGIRKVCISEAKSPNPGTVADTIILETTYLLQFHEMVSKAKLMGMEELIINSLILENS